MRRKNKIFTAIVVILVTIIGLRIRYSTAPTYPYFRLLASGELTMNMEYTRYHNGPPALTPGERISFNYHNMMNKIYLAIADFRNESSIDLKSLVGKR